MSVPNLPVDPAFARRFPHIIEYGWAVRDRFRFLPRPEPVSERKHVGIGSHSRIAEKIPGTAARVSPFQDCKAPCRTFLLQVIGCTDSGKPRAYDHYVEVLDTLRAFCRKDCARFDCRHFRHLIPLARIQSANGHYQILPSTTARINRCAPQTGFGRIVRRL